MRLNNTADRAARRHNGRHADAVERGFQLQLDRKRVERGGVVQDGPVKRRFRGLTYVKPFLPACHAVPGPLSSACLGRKRVLEIHTLRARAVDMR